MPAAQCYRLAQQDDTNERNGSTDEDDTEKIPEMPYCTGAKGENVGVDCKKDLRSDSKKKHDAQKEKSALAQ